MDLRSFEVIAINPNLSIKELLRSENYRSRHRETAEQDFARDDVPEVTGWTFSMIRLPQGAVRELVDIAYTHDGRLKKEWINGSHVERAWRKPSG